LKRKGRKKKQKKRKKEQGKHRRNSFNRTSSSSSSSNNSHLQNISHQLLPDGSAPNVGLVFLMAQQGFALSVEFPFDL